MEYIRILSQTMPTTGKTEDVPTIPDIVHGKEKGGRREILGRLRSRILLSLTITDVSGGRI
jgi:hypothetical protein